MVGIASGSNIDRLDDGVHPSRLDLGPESLSWA